MNLRFKHVLYTVYALLLAIPPLYMSSRTSELFEFNKLMVIYMLSGIIVGLWLTASIVSRKIVFTRHVLVWPFVLFVLSQLASTWFSIDRHTSIFGYYGRFNGGLLSTLAYVVIACVFITFFIQANFKQTRALVHKLLHVSMLSSILVMLWGLPSRFGYDLTCFLFTGQLNVSCWTDQFKPTIRLFSTLGQPNWLGAYLAVHFIFGLYFYLVSKRQLHRVMYALYSLATFTLILYTRSRSAYIALAVTSLVLIIYYVSISFNTIRNRLYEHVLFIVSGVVLVLGVGTGIEHIDELLKSSTSSQTSASKQIERPEAITESGDIRKIVWQGGLGLGMEYPLFGTGVETFGYSYPFVRSMDHNRTSEWDFVYNKAHNEYVNMLATTGLFGLLTYIVMQGVVLLFARHGLAKYRESSDQGLIVIALVSAYVSIMVTNFFGFTTTTISIFTYMLPAMLVILTSYGPRSADEIKIEEKDMSYLFVPVFFVLAVGWFVGSYIRADRAYARAESLSRSGEYQEAMIEMYRAYGLRKEHVYADKLSEILAQLSIQEAQATSGTACVDAMGKAASCIELSRLYAQKSIQGSPSNSAYYRSQARNSFVFYQATQKEEYFKEALKLIDRARLFAPTDPKLLYYKSLFALGYLELAQKPTKKHFDILERIGLPSIEFAIILKPNYADAYYIKGLIYKNLKDTESARKTFQYVLDTIDPQHEQIIQELKGL